MSLLKMDGYDDCVIGIVERFGNPNFLVYDKKKIISRLIKDGMTEEEAIEYYEFNMLGAWVGEATVGFVTVKNKKQKLDDFVDDMSGE
jgi:hypothetical protein